MGAAHVSQLLTLLPNINGSEKDPNLKIGKGLQAYVKVT
jgi:hypothetical protein